MRYNMDPNNVTYQQFDELLRQLHFDCRKVNPRWKRYEHPDTDTVIIVGDLKPTEFALANEVLSARFVLEHKGLIEPDEFDEFFNNGPAKQKTNSKNAQKTNRTKNGRRKK